jgi:hypothetical protein
MEQQVSLAKDCGALFVNSRTGSDFFSFENNVQIFQHAEKLSQKHDFPIYHETHRGKALCNLPIALSYLEALPELKITADLSHYMCVHESDLRERGSWVDPVIERSRHIHARVGFPQGPQVAHPLAPERAELLALYLEWWKKIITVNKQSGAPFICITPEAGPPGYMPVLPFSNVPVADAWTVNVQMKDWLKTKL